MGQQGKSLTQAPKAPRLAVQITQQENIMKTIVQFLSSMFESKWNYDEDEMIRVHKVTGKVQYRDWDDWGYFWLEAKQ
jgi:hypothetical protein